MPYPSIDEVCCATLSSHVVLMQIAHRPGVFVQEIAPRHLSWISLSSLPSPIFIFCLFFICLACLHCSLQDALATDFTALTKTLYDLHKAQQPAGLKGSPLDLLVVENFDEEQIWQELELQNSPVLGQFQEAVSHVTADTGLSVLAEAEEDKDVSEGDDIGDDDDGNEDAEDKDLSEDEMDEGEGDEDEEENDAHPGSKDGEGFSDEDSDLDFDVDALEKKAKQKVNQKGSTARLAKPKWAEPSEVDDKFFKLSDMEAFLDDMDRREGKDDQGGEDIDYFQDLPSGDEELTFDKPTSSKQQKKVGYILNSWSLCE